MGNHHDNGATAIKLRLALLEGLVLSHVVGAADIGRHYVNGGKVRIAVIPRRIERSALDSAQRVPICFVTEEMPAR